VCDEIASHRTSQVYDVLLTAMGKRRHPLLASISTATANNSGVGRSLWNYAARVLEGRQTDARLFALIHSADDTDDIWDERTWIKANPNWGVSVQPDAVRAIARQARNNPVQESAFKTRHLNLWVGADDALFSMRAWRLCKREGMTPADFRGWRCDIAVDLAAKTDLAAVQITFSREDPETRQLRYATFGRYYTPEAVILEARQAEYAAWGAGGHMIATPGNEIDFSRIEDDLLKDCAAYEVGSVAYDPWSATQLAQRLQAQGVPVIEFRATTQNFSEPTKELEAAMQASRIEHDGNPVLDWCIGNVVGHYDPRGNVYPRKSRPEQKIDGAISLIMTIGRAISAREEIPYGDGRGLLIL
jgi:phage terminase large subunit-like protein